MNTSEKKSMAAAGTSLQQGLHFSRVTRIFETRDAGDLTALSNFDLLIRPAEFVAIVGPSGCGKSTLLTMAAGLDTPSSGEVILEGRSLQAPHPASATVFQADHLLPWRTVVDNILLPLQLRRPLTPLDRAKALDLMKQVNLQGFEDRYPHELSGGMRQRVSICRALIQEPKLLLMDEPFGALDALTREQMASDLQRLWLNLRNSVLFITHGIDEAVFLADRIVVMTSRPGRIAMIVDNPMERPRRWKDAIKDPRFQEMSLRIRDAFEAQGVLH